LSKGPLLERHTSDGRNCRPRSEEETMCPACLTTLALIAAGAGSAGGLATSVVWKFRARPAEKGLIRAASAETPAKKEESR